MASILIVDDEPGIREVLVALLDSQGHQVLEAADGAEALRTARASRPDLVLTDVIMPTMDGYELVRQLRMDPDVAHTPVVFHTAFYHHQEALALARACGVAHLLAKPAPLSNILQTVDAALAGKVPAPPPPPGEFDREHQRLLTDQLAQEAAALRAANARLTALIEVTRQVALERDQKRLLDQFCLAARDVLGARYAVVGLLDPARQAFHTLRASGLGPEGILRLGRPSPRAGLLKKILDEGRPLRVADLGGNPEAAETLRFQPPARSFLGTPVASATRLYGVLFLADKLGADAFTFEDEGVAVALAALLAITYENVLHYEELQRHAARLEEEVEERVRAEESLEASRGRLQALSRQLLAAQETERRHIARELHDEVGQALTAVKINLQTMGRGGAAAPPAPRLEESIRIVERTLEQVRNLSLDLRPSILDDLGLVAAARWYLDRQAQRAGIAAHLVVDLPPEPLPPEVETACFRVLQEAVTNVVRHAGAREVRVVLARRGEELHLAVRDDGAGFDVAAARARAARGGSLGLLGMQERVILLGGRMDVSSAPARGAEIQVWFPLSSAPAAGAAGED